MRGHPRKRLAQLPLPVARVLGHTPLLSEDERLEVARRAALWHVERGEAAEAEDAVRDVLGGKGLPRKKADLLDEVVSGILSLGEEPELLGEAVAARLRIADAQLGRGRTTAAAHSFAKAVHLAFDRNVHFDSTTSPLARDPRGFTAPLRDSAFARRLRAPRGREILAESAGSGSTSSVVVGTRGNDNFLREILAMLHEHPAVKAQFVDFAVNKNMSRGIANPSFVAEEILNGKHGMARRAERVLRPYLDEADVFFVEWCTALAVLVGLVDPRDTRVVVRLHSYEVFTRWPHLLDFSRIDDMVFVSEHVRDLALDAIPGLGEPEAPRLHVLPLAMDLRAYVAPKPDPARFNLALVGWGSVAKDPLWAFEVLRRLRETDNRYQLLLVGADFADDKSPATARYAERMHKELAELEAVGAVRRLGQRDDVPDVLTDVGVILSTSVRESFHAALVEGAASGAVPVVRDWPFFAGRPTGARTLYPAHWMVETPEQAARRILETTADAASWRDEGESASRHALATWDWDVVRPGYERLLLG